VGNSSPAHSGCLDENTLSEFAEGRVDPTATKRIIEHVAACSECRAALACAAPAADTTAEEERSTPSRLNIGDIVSDRFVIERLAGSGGMGTVYRALDRVAGMPVAIKVMTQPRSHDNRFAQEARVLAELQHPAIVGYVAHGSTAQGHNYLAMQWLEGEDLARRLSRSALDLTESLAIGRSLAGALAAAHARGMVHRDVKPSNVQLVAGDPYRAMLLDFGIVHMGLSGMATTARPRTQTGTVLGTVGYMSPEQAVADKHIDARADVFALGCVLYECLTGEPAFFAAHVAAVLAKVLREEAPRVRELRPELPQAVDDLVGRLLAKDRSKRPEDGAAVLRELEALGTIEAGAPVAATVPQVGLSGGEQWLVSVMLAAVTDPTDPLGQIVRRRGGDPARLANGTFLITVGGRSSPGEQVIAAAECATALYEALPSARIALATGRARSAAGGLAGPVIDHAAALLAESTSPGVRVDRVTASLIEERFSVRPDGTLLARRGEAESPRTLLGRPTPCVGRDKELALLELTLRECVDESVSRAVLVTGPAGRGKSRLRYEFVVKVRERGGVTILTARADPMGAGSAFLMARQLVRQAIGIREGDPASRQYAKLRMYVEEVCRGVDCARIADFLGELMAILPSDRPSPELRAARNDPQIMATWLGRAFDEWLAAECARGPLLVVLEDLHWGDLPSVTYLGEGLRAQATKPLMLLALARPEVHDTFPSLWSAAEKHEIALGRLAPRVAERLVRAALGEGLAGDVVARVVERADGNAFYLEELIRHVAEGAGDAFPETVLALVQSRFERLEPEGRRILRAASVFGEVFWGGGVAALLGKADPEDPAAWLEALARGEMISAVTEGRYPGDHEYVFRHGRLREAAYAMLTEEDLTTGHRLAAEWLERVGEKDALMLADHFVRGGERKRAAPWLLLAAQTAMDGGNLEAAMALASRGIACDPNDDHRGQLRLVQADALTMWGQLPEALEMSREAMGSLKAGTAEWFASAGITLQAGTFRGDLTVVASVLEAIIATPDPPEPSVPYGEAVSQAAFSLAVVGQLESARAFLKRAESVGASAPEPDPVFNLRLRLRHAYLDMLEGQLGSALADLPECLRLADRVGDTKSQTHARVFVSLTLGFVGHHERAEAACRELHAFCERRGFRLLFDWSTLNLASIRFHKHRDEAIASLSGLLDRSDRLLAATARTVLGYLFALEGDLDKATREATRALEGGAISIPRTNAFATLALVARRRGQAEDALGFAEQGIENCLRSPSPSGASILYLERAAALYALGRKQDAHAAIREARSRVLRIAATLDDPDLRHSYLTHIGANARTLQLAKEWLGEDDS
jgi:tetratricopeptide (TPR) repeat protein